MELSLLLSQKNIQVLSTGFKPMTTAIRYNAHPTEPQSHPVQFESVEFESILKMDLNLKKLFGSCLLYTELCQ